MGIIKAKERKARARITLSFFVQTQTEPVKITPTIQRHTHKQTDRSMYRTSSIHLTIRIGR